MPNFATGREERMQLELRDLSRLTRFASSRTRWILKRCVKSNWADSDAVSGLGKGLIFPKHLGKAACLNSMPPCQNLKLQTHFRASSGWAYELQTWSEPYLAKQQATTAFVFRELLRVQRVSCFKILHKEFGLWNFATSIWIEGLWKSATERPELRRWRPTSLWTSTCLRKVVLTAIRIASVKLTTPFRETWNFQGFSEWSTWSGTVRQSMRLEVFSCLRWKNMVCICLSCLCFSSFILMTQSKDSWCFWTARFGCNVFWFCVSDVRCHFMFCRLGVCTSSVLRCWTVSSLVFLGLTDYATGQKRQRQMLELLDIVARHRQVHFGWRFHSLLRLGRKISIMHWPNPHLRILTRLFNVVAYGKSILLTALFFQLFPTRFADWLEHVIFWVPPCVANSVKQKQRKERTRRTRAKWSACDYPPVRAERDCALLQCSDPSASSNACFLVQSLL